MKGRLLKTCDVVKLLNVPYYALLGAIRVGKFTPLRDASGDHVYDEKTLAAARVAMADYRPRKKRRQAQRA
jgi:hypothetical protein